jgi:type IV pilus assembly protein PilV
MKQVRRIQRGVTMIELLITVFVLSIGLLGLAQLQASALRNNQSAYLRTQATVLAYDIADRMRANMPAVRTAAYHLPTTTAHATCRNVSGCTPTEMAQTDAAMWTAAVAASLPGGEAVVCIDSDPDSVGGTGVGSPDCDNTGNMFAIKIWWDDDRNPATPNQRFVTSFQP